MTEEKNNPQNSEKDETKKEEEVKTKQAENNSKLDPAESDKAETVGNSTGVPASNSISKPAPDDQKIDTENPVKETESDEKAEKNQAEKSSEPEQVVSDTAESHGASSTDENDKLVNAGDEIDKPTKQVADTESDSDTRQDSDRDEDEEDEKEDDDAKGFDKDGQDDEHETKDNTDYSNFSKEELVNALADMLAAKPALRIRHDVETIKILFYKKHRSENEAKKEAFIEEGGEPEDFEITPDPLEEKLKELLTRFRKSKADHNRNLELDKEANLKIKYEIIEELKDLVNKEESLNETFKLFRELQMKWRQAGVVPQNSLKDLWDNYHHHVEKFYDYVKINKELRDLDLKKNMEVKIILCEKAEGLLLEPSVIKAFNALQKFHDEWRETGPVPIEKKDELWERFKEATLKINKKHHEYFDEQKEQQKKNLELKSALCEKVEEISSREINSHSAWDKNSNTLIKIQNEWKTIGFAPKKYNNKIYKRFRKACDVFFQRKREFYAGYRQEQQDNMQLKIDLCVQAESLKESTEWKKTTEELIQIQKRWKEIGPVPRKQSDVVWKRFRSACDAFFENKSKYFQEKDGSYEENLKKKETLIVAINSYTFTDNVEKNFQALKDFQREWTEIGFVPRKQKDEIANKYREAINKRFDELKVDDGKKNLLKFKNRVDTYNATKKGRRISGERDKLANKLKQLETDISLLENNIGFFANTKNAESMIKEVQGKIDSARKEIELVQEKINVIDDLEED